MVKLDGLTPEQWIAEGLALGLEPFEVVRALQREPLPRKVGNLLHLLRNDLEGGVPFSDALAKHPDCFSDDFVSVVEGGEASGRLSGAASAFVRCETKRASDVLETTRLLAYPLLVFGVLLIPRLLSLLSADRADVYFGGSGEVVGPTYTVVTYVAIALVVVTALAIAGVAFRPRLVRPLAAMLPGVSRVLLLRTTAFAADNLARMLRAGKPLVDALQVASKSDGAQSLRKTVSRIKAGAPVSEAFDAGGRVGRLLRGPVTVTAGRGDLALTLERSAHEHRAEAGRVESIARGAYWLLILFACAAFVGLVMYQVYAGQLGAYPYAGVQP